MTSNNDSWEKKKQKEKKKSLLSTHICSKKSMHVSKSNKHPNIFQRVSENLSWEFLFQYIPDYSFGRWESNVFLHKDDGLNAHNQTFFFL